ncbi:MAG: hypothetical protein AAGJ87_01010 [Pseudomonadota bacterium]
MRIVAIAAFAALAAFSASPAVAQPVNQGAKILQIGGADARTNQGAGVECRRESGVRLCGAAPRAEEPELAGGETAVRQTIITERIIIDRPFRLIRRLRTQGFYSGNIYPSRRFTQGFYADRIAAGH